MVPVNLNRPAPSTWHGAAVRQQRAVQSKQDGVSSQQSTVDSRQSGSQAGHVPGVVTPRDPGSFLLEPEQAAALGQGPWPSQSGGSPADRQAAAFQHHGPPPPRHGACDGDCDWPGSRSGSGSGSGSRGPSSPRALTPSPRPPHLATHPNQASIISLPRQALTLT